MAIKRVLGEYFFIALTVLIGLVATFGLAWEEYQFSNNQVRAAFKNDADERLDLITQSINNNLHVVQSVVSFYNAAGEVDENSFRTYVSALIKDYPYLEAIVWAPIVKNADRQVFEANAQKTNPNFQFRQRDPRDKNNFIPAAIHDEYAPIYFTQPVRNARVFGYDYLSDPLRGAALQLARQSRQMAVTSKVVLLTKNESGVLLFAPVYRQGTLQGVIGCIMPMKSLIDLPLEPLTPRGNNVIIRDLSNNGEVLHVRPSRIANMSAEAVTALYDSHLTIRESRVINIAGKKWEATVLPATGYYATQITQEVWMVLIFGLAFTLLLAYYMLRNIRETSNITKEVAARTRELTHTKRELELILNSTKEGVIGIDKNAIITFSNIMAPLMLGYKKNDIIGQSFYDLVLRLKPEDAEKNTVVQSLRMDTENKAVDDQLFWRRNSKPMKVEYTASSLIENNTITGAVIVFRDITERKLYEANLEQMALFDQLTQLPNRRQFIDILKKSLARAQRTKHKIGVIYLDLNDFKIINDTKGHAVGDLVLKGFADCVKAGIREYDTAGRLGGDEFAIIADNITSPRECEVIIQRLLNALEKPIETEEGNFNLSASIGIALYPDDAKTLDELIAAADGAMYQAKKNKKKPYIFHIPHGTEKN